MSADPYADRSYDDNMEPLCGLPEPAAPSNGLASEMIDITRTAASDALNREYSWEIPAGLPPAQPEKQA